MSPLLESHALQKPVGLSSFLTNGHVCLCPLVQAWAEASSHPGQVIQPPQLTQVLSSLCHKLVAPRLCVGYWAPALVSIWGALCPTSCELPCLHYKPSALGASPFSGSSSLQKATALICYLGTLCASCLSWQEGEQSLCWIWGSPAQIGVPCFPVSSAPTYPVTVPRPLMLFPGCEGPPKSGVPFRVIPHGPTLILTTLHLLLMWALMTWEPSR